LLLLEGRQTELNQLIEAAPPPVPRFHPKLAEVYRTMVSDLRAALNDPVARDEAAEILRGLIERVTVRADAQLATKLPP
jgi:site-specific DNA recombinase